MPLVQHQAVLIVSQTGVCKETLTQHTDVVAALTWLPDNSGFISGGLDRKIIFWVGVHHFPNWSLLTSMTCRTLTAGQSILGHLALSVSPTWLSCLI